MTRSIRNAVNAERDTLRGVFRRASLSNEDDRSYLLGHPESFVLSEEGVRQGRTRVAVESNGTIVGFASYRIAQSVIELEDLFVDPPWMRQGVGRALVLDIVAIARAQGFERLEVTANPHAMAFYQSMGFGVDHMEKTEFYPAPRMSRSTA